MSTGIHNPVNALAVYNGELFATSSPGGHDGDVNAPGIWRWTGEAWSDLAPAGTLDSSSIVTAVAMCLFEGRLAVSYQLGDEIGRTRVALWDGQSWEQLPTTDINIGSLLEFQGSLYAGGSRLQPSPSMNLRRWNGSEWMVATPWSFPPSDPSPVFALCVHDNRLWISGDFPWSASQRHDLWTWNGTQWGLYGTIPGNIFEMALHDGLLHIGGNMTGAGDVGFSSIAVWDSGWRAVSSSGATNGTVYAFLPHGGELAVAGSFEVIEGFPARRIAKWDGAHWSSFGNGLNGNVYGLVKHQGQLVALGSFSNTVGGVGSPNIAVWNGSSWGGCGRGLQGGPSRYGLHGAVMGDDLYVCGRFDYVDNNLPVRDLAKWNGEQWSGVQTEAGEVRADNDVNDIAIFEGDLIIGGLFRTPTRAIGRYNGVTWEPMSPGQRLNEVDAVEVHNGELYIAGSLASGGDPPLRGIAKWNGGSWEPVGGGIGEQPLILRMVSTPYGLVVTGQNLRLGMTDEDDGLTRSMLLWDGENWIDIMGEGLELIFGIYGDAGSLFVGGTFDQIGGVQASRIAEWRIALDTDRSGGVDLADVFGFLSAYFQNARWTDWNEDGTWTVEDVFAYLSDWFAGCP